MPSISNDDLRCVVFEMEVEGVESALMFGVGGCDMFDNLNALIIAGK